jgi:hypothetical protein
MFHSVKSKVLPNRPNEKRLKEACSTAVSALQTTLSIAKDVTSMAGVPGLQVCISSLLAVIDVIKARHISLRWSVLVTFDDPENDSKRGGYRETCESDRGIEHLSSHREDWKNIPSGGRCPNRSSSEVCPISGAFGRPNSCPSSALRKVSEEMKAISSHGLMKRLIHHDDDIQLIGGHIQAIAWTIQSFPVCYYRCADCESAQ